MKHHNKKALFVNGLILAAACLAGCGGNNGGGGGGTGKATSIRFQVFQGTAGVEWAKEACERFSKLHAADSYEEGKTGVKFSISQKEHVDYDTLNTDGNDVYLDENLTDVYALSAKKWILNLDEVVAPLADRIEPDALLKARGADGHYYALPSYEWYPGVTYDKDLFDAKGYYFTNDDTGVAYQGKFGAAYFVGPGAALEKSVGPNGIKGDYDDGLPSSLQELCILCDHMKEEGDSPFIIAGKASVYSFYLTTGLWASLTGAAMRDVYCNYRDEAVDLVTGYTNDDLFYSGSGFKAPSTEKVVLNDENGYRMYDMANRYYALSFFNLAVNEGWFAENHLKNSNCEAIMAQDYFVRGYQGTHYGMLYDASYWCHEAAENNSFKNYAKDHPDAPDRHVSFLPLPSQLSGSVAEGEGKKLTLINDGASSVFVNARVASNEGKMKAVKDFLSFLYSDSELAAFSEKLGLTIPMRYDYDMSKLSNSYYSDLATIRKASDVIQYSSSSTRFLKNMSSFSLYYDAPTNRFSSPAGVTLQNGYLEAITRYNCTASYIFDATKMSADIWSKMDH